MIKAQRKGRDFNFKEVFWTSGCFLCAAIVGLWSFNREPRGQWDIRDDSVLVLQISGSDAEAKIKVLSGEL